MKKAMLFGALALILGLAGAQDYDTLFFDDFETCDLSGWARDTLFGSQWHTYDGTFAYDGFSWWCGSEDIGGYGDDWMHALYTPAIELPETPTGTISMTMMMKIALEDPPATPTDVGDCVVDGWDAFHVRISTDDGATWALLEPTEGYPYDTCYGFWSNGEFELLAGYCGMVDWTEKEFDLTGYEGDTIILAFVMGSDVAYSTSDNPLIIGAFVDNIDVADDGDSYYYDDAGDSLPTEMTSANLAVALEMTVSSDAMAYEGTCAMLAPNIHSDGPTYSVISPSFYIPEDFLGTISYMVYRDAPDDNGDGDDYLDDFYLVYISIDDGLSWTMIARDKYLDGIDPVWVHNEFTSGIWDAVPGLQLYDYRDNDVRVKFLFYFDDNDDGGVGDGFYIDNFTIYGFYGNIYDAGVSNILPSPINLDEPATINVEVMGYGVETANPSIFYGIYDSEDTLLETGLLGSTNLDLFERYYDSFDFTPTEAGDFYILVWTLYTADEDPSNDTLRYDFSVGENLLEMGFDDGMLDTFLLIFEPADTYIQWYLWQNIGDTVEDYRDGSGVVFRNPSPTGVSIQRMAFHGFGEGNVSFKVFEVDSVDGPDYTPFAEYSYTLPENYPNTYDYGSWVFYDLETELDIPGTMSFFMIMICGDDADSWIDIATDYTEARDVTYFSQWYEDYGLYIHNHQEGYIPYLNEVTAMIRCQVDWVDGIADKDSRIPAAIVLNRNAPNPFNPATEISFELPEVRNITLEVLDVSGRIVRTLMNDELDVGTHTVIWDGTDEANSDMPSGIYFYRLSSGNQVQMRKMTLVR